MALRIRFQYATSHQLAFSVERLRDGLFYDFADGIFKASPAKLTAPLPEDTGAFLGRYKATVDATPVAQWTNGSYAITVHDSAYLAANEASVVAELASQIFAGDDAPYTPVFPALPASLPVTLTLPTTLAGSISLGS